MEGDKKQLPSGRPPRASVPAFGGWEGGAQAPDYSLDFTNIRAARMQRRAKALSWSSFVGDAANAAVAAEEEREKPPRHHPWSSSPSAASDGDEDHDGRQRRLHHRRRRSADADADDRLPIRPGRRAGAAPKGSGKFKGYLFGCVGGVW